MQTFLKRGILFAYGFQIFADSIPVFRTFAPFPPVYGILVFSIKPVAEDCRKCRKCHTCTRAAHGRIRRARRFPEMYSGILLLMGMSALMYAALEIAERVLCRWRYGSRGKA